MVRKLVGALGLSLLLVVGAWFAMRPGTDPGPRPLPPVRHEDAPPPDVIDEVLPESAPEVIASALHSIDLGLGAAVLTGVLLDPAGAPHPGAEVTLHRSNLPTDVEEDGAISVVRLVDLSEGTTGAIRRWVSTGEFPFRREIEGALPRLASVTTDASGSYRFEGLASGTYLVAGHAPDCLVTPSRSVEHLVGGETRVDVRLLAAGRLTGFVVSEEGDPVLDAEVRIVGEIVPFDEGLNAMVLARDELLLYLLNRFSARMRVDGEGSFSFDRLPFLDYRVIARSKEWAATEKIHPVPEPAPLEIVLELGGVIEGTVSDVTGASVAGIEVELSLERSRGIDAALSLTAPPPTQTSSDGRFRFVGLAPETYRVIASGPGWQSSREGGLLIESGGVREVELVVERGAVLSGTVVDAEGNPIADVEVQARQYSESNGRTNQRGRVTTDVSGQFRLDTVPEGEYVLEATKPGWLEGEVDVPSNAEPVTIVLERGALVSGRVVGPDGTALPRAWVEVPRGWNESERTEVDGDGGFRFHLSAEEEFTLVVRCRGFAEARVEVGAGGGDLGTIALAASVEISGIVFGPEGAPLAGARVVASRQDFARSGRWRAPTRRETVWTDAEGRFAIEADDPLAEYTLTARVPELLPSEALKIALAGASVSDVEIWLRWGASVFGVVTGPTNLPIDGALVELRQTNVRGRGLRESARTDSNGEYQISGMRAGTFQVRVSAARHASMTVPEVPLGEDESRRVDLRLGPERRLTGVVLGPTRLEVAGARVSVSEEGAARRTTTTDPRGEFVVDRLGRGSLTITIEAEGFLRYREDGFAASDGPLEVILEPAYTIVGVITDGVTGEPIPRARARATRIGEGSRRSRWQRSDNLGRFEIGDLSVGEYELQVTATGYISFTAGEIRVPSRDPDEQLLVNLRAGGRVRGRILDSVGRELSGVNVSAHPLADDVGDDIPAPRGRPAARDRSEDDGTFSLVGLENGRYTLTFSHGEHLTERQAVVVDIDRAEPYVTVNLERGGVIEGMAYLANGVAAQDGAVRLSGEASRRSRLRFSNPGRFRFAGLPPGTYTVTYSPNPRSAEATAAVEVELPPRGSRTVDLHAQ